MTAVDPKLVLSAVETEALRQMRTRLNKPAVSDAACATLGRAFLSVAERNGFGPSADPAGLQVMQAAVGPGAEKLMEASKVVGLNTLAVLTAVLKARLDASPAEWRRLVADGAPQALITRRLQLAGREGVEARG